MTKLEKRENVQNYQISHVKEILKVLNRKKLKIKCYVNLLKNEFLLKVDNVSVEMSCCRDVCELLFPYYEKEKVEMLKELLERKLKKYE